MHTNGTAKLSNSQGMVNTHTHPQKWKCILLISPCNPWVEMLPELPLSHNKAWRGGSGTWSKQKVIEVVKGCGITEGEWWMKRGKVPDRPLGIPTLTRWRKRASGGKSWSRRGGRERFKPQCHYSQGGKGFQRDHAQLGSTERWDSWGQKSAQVV